MKHKKKVMFFLPSFDMGGGERVLSELSLHFPSYIETVIVVLEKKISYPYKGTLISLDIPTPRSFIMKVYWAIITCIRFKRIQWQQKPDTTLSIGILPNLINALMGRNAVVRVGNSLSEGYWGVRATFLHLVVPFLFKRTKKIVAISHGLKQDLIKNFSLPESHIKVIHNPVDIKKIERLAAEPLEEKYKELFDHPVIINIGRLSEQKGQWYLLRAFNTLKRSYPTAKLVILGEGYYEHYIKQVYNELPVKDDIYFLGWQKNPFKFLVRSRLFVLPSLWEGLGNVIIEAMACGLPVISFDCPSGPRDILSPQSNPALHTTTIEYAPYGILTPVGDEKKLARAMATLFDDPKLYTQYQHQSKKRARDFDIAKIITTYQSLI